MAQSDDVGVSQSMREWESQLVSLSESESVGQQGATSVGDCDWPVVGQSQGRNALGQW